MPISSKYGEPRSHGGSRCHGSASESGLLPSSVERWSVTGNLEEERV